MTEYMLCQRKLFYTHRHKPDILAILYYFICIKMSFYIRQLIKSCKQSLILTLANCNLLSVPNYQHCLFFYSSCLCFRLHRKTSRQGQDVGIRMGHEILKRGFRQDDVIYADERKIIAVCIPPSEAIRMTVDKEHPHQIAKLCYEVGNTHTSMFRGEDAYTFYAPYHEALLDKVDRICGVTGEKVLKSFDFGQALSSSVNDHHH